MVSNYRLGLPAWAFPGWRGTVFNRSEDSLPQYSRVFNAVEGNTTFYAPPSAGKVACWKETLNGIDFKICFKLPQTVTHRRFPVWRDLSSLLQALEPLEPWLGPLLLQFPPTADHGDAGRLDQLRRRLPSTWPRVVEWRDASLYKSRAHLKAFLSTRTEQENIVLMDANPLHNGDPTHPDVAGALHEKPAQPNLELLLQQNPALPFMLRLVLHPEADSTANALETYAAQISTVCDRYREVFVTVHCPNNLHCPAFARRFHDHLSAHRSVGSLPPWPLPQQESLF
ncbi:MAG: DUF72 domain-containing protein [Pseudomonadota bacterium]